MPADGTGRAMGTLDAMTGFQAAEIMPLLNLILVTLIFLVVSLKKSQNPAAFRRSDAVGPRSDQSYLLATWATRILTVTSGQDISLQREIFSGFVTVCSLESANVLRETLQLADHD